MATPLTGRPYKSSFPVKPLYSTGLRETLVVPQQATGLTPTMRGARPRKRREPVRSGTSMAAQSKERIRTIVDMGTGRSATLAPSSSVPLESAGESTKRASTNNLMSEINSK